jgi:hypothetical protein
MTDRLTLEGMGQYSMEVNPDDARRQAFVDEIDDVVGQERGSGRALHELLRETRLLIQDGRLPELADASTADLIGSIRETNVALRGVSRKVTAVLHERHAEDLLFGNPGTMTPEQLAQLEMNLENGWMPEPLMMPTTAPFSEPSAGEVDREIKDGLEKVDLDNLVRHFIHTHIDDPSVIGELLAGKMKTGEPLSLNDIRLGQVKMVIYESRDQNAVA